MNNDNLNDRRENDNRVSKQSHEGVRGKYKYRTKFYQRLK